MIPNKLKHYLLALLLLAGVILPTQAQKKQLDLKEITNGTFRQAGIEDIQSMLDGEHYTVLEAGSQVVKYAYNTGEVVEVIFDASKQKQKLPGIQAYHFSGNEAYLLLETEVQAIYRHSYKANYYLYNTKTAELRKLSEGKQQLASFSPDNKSVAFVRENNLFMVDLESNKEIQITKDGKFNSIINGAPDWVYEEEFSFAKGYQWSPESKFIAFYKFDESKVKTFGFTMFEGAAPAYSKYQIYPQEYRFKYPKAGEDNSVVSIHTYELSSGKTRTMDVGSEKDQYIPRIKWTQTEGSLAMVRMNRHQNKYELMLADASSGKSKVIYTETNKAWVEINDDLTFLKDKKHFVLSSEKSGFNHLYLMSLDGKSEKQITSGDWEVTKYLGIDEKKNMLYFEAAAESPMQREVYSIRLNGKNRKKLSQKSGWNSARFSEGFKYYIHFHSNANTPRFISLHNNKGKLIRVLEDNKILSNKLATYQLPSKEFFNFKTSEGVDLNAWVLKPADFDASKTYPAVLYIYGGPGSQTVKDNWSMGWYEYLASQGIVVYSVDNRGTGARGEAFKKCTYMQLQNLELLDLVETSKYIKSLPYHAGEKIGVYGWSFGGQMSSLCMLRGAGNFDVGIAVAPVTTYRYYDNIYSERYLRTPQENPEGYDKYSAITYADKLEGKYLLIHGTADDNVHVQNAMELAERLVQANKQFDMFYYTNRNHGIYGGNTRFHLFTKMTNYFKEHLDKDK